MKKVFSLFIFGTLLLSFSACSPNGSRNLPEEVSSAYNSAQDESKKEDQKTEASGSGFSDTKLAQGFGKLINSDKYYCELSAEKKFFDNDYKISISLAKDKENFYMDISFADMEYAILKKPDTSYIMLPKLKICTEMKYEDISDKMSFINSIIGDELTSLDGFDISGFELKDSGNEEYNGKTYDFEVYSTYGSDIKFYFENDNPVYIMVDPNVGAILGNDDSSSYEKKVVSIDKLTSDFDASIFEIPKDYTITQFSLSSIFDINNYLQSKQE